MRMKNFPKKIMALFAMLSFLSLSITAADDATALLDDQSEGPESLANSLPFFSAKYKPKNGDLPVIMKFGGNVTPEMFASSGTTLLNNPKLEDFLAPDSIAAALNDRVIYARGTADFKFNIMYAQDPEDPRVDFYSAWRFRHNYGGQGQVTDSSSAITIANTIVNIPATPITKHLLWTREAWLKLALDNIDSDRHVFAQFGLFPYQVGNGISLGASYQASGFMGFSSGFTIDQYAPGATVHVDVVPDVLDFNAYFALLLNQNEKVEQNNELIRVQQIDNTTGSNTRGTSTQSWIFALNPKWMPFHAKDNKVTIEPYLVQYHAPDQKLEFPADADVYMRTFGLYVSQETKNAEWSMEFGMNGGFQNVKAWDRNIANIVVADDGKMTALFSKVVAKVDNSGEDFPLYLDPTDPDFEPLPATTDNIKALLLIAREVDQNGRLIEHVNLGHSVLLGADDELLVYSTYDRFRPAQRKIFDGWFFVTDGCYKIKKWNTKISWMGAWASGDLDDRVTDANKASESFLMNQRYEGFVPLQSVYAGDKVNMFVMLNQGIPRFSVADPTGAKKFIGNPLPPTASKLSFENAFSNIMILGSAVEWKPKQLEEYETKFKINALVYGMPTPPFTKNHERAHKFLGTELNLKIGVKVLQVIELSSYTGVLFPGQLYTDMKGISLSGSTSGGVIGDSPCYAVNFGFKFVF